MASISSSGVGSGLDINSLVSQLVAAERSAPEKRISREDAGLTTEFTAMAALKGAMAGFQGAVTALRTPSAFDLRKATVADEDVFTAAVTSEAAAGSYDVEVMQLANAARIGSNVYAGGPDSVVGTGTLTLSMGSSSFSVSVTSDSDTLAQIRDSINSAQDNPGVRATLIRNTAGTGSYLVLSGTATGAANTISVSATGADAGLTQLVTDLQTADPVRDVVAQDAIVFISGYEIHSASNTVSGAVDGVTLSLKKSAAGTPVRLTVERDDSAVQRRAESFVAAYNTLVQQIATLSRYDAATQTAGPLLGDSMLRGLDSQLRRLVSERVPGSTGAYSTLSSLGIRTTATGTLQLNASEFQQAQTADPAAIGRLFASEDGIAVRLAEVMDSKLSAGGEVSARDARIATRRRELSQQKDALDARMQVIQARYMKQFTALDTMLSQMQSTSNYLTQQLTSLSNLNK